MCQLGFKKKKTRLSSFQSHTGILGGIDMDWVLVNSIGHTADWFKSMGLDWGEGAQARSRGLDRGVRCIVRDASFARCFAIF